MLALDFLKKKLKLYKQRLEQAKLEFSEIEERLHYPAKNRAEELFRIYNYRKQEVEHYTKIVKRIHDEIANLIA